MFWGADGTPMSAAQFLENLFGTLPEFFKDEDELRAIWSAPDTRKAFMLGLEEKGFGKEIMTEMQSIIEAEKSDLFDVLAYVALALEPITRADRAANAKQQVHNSFNAKQEAFIDFVLAQYVSQGVEELDAEKITPLLRLRYNDSHGADARRLAQHHHHPNRHAGASSESSAALASILPCENSSISSPWTIENSPPEQVTGNPAMMSAGTP